MENEINKTVFLLIFYSVLLWLLKEWTMDQMEFVLLRLYKCASEMQVVVERTV